ncbi:MAG TPA: VOC family protein [Candidatus Dormibacteraeota bacterium]|nr:VOC family protein [Candidatus Dormibacteraeota bacterium]
MTNRVRTCLTFKDRAEEAVNLYVSLFPNSTIIELSRVEADAGPLRKGQLLGAIFELDGREFRAFDGGETFSFSEGISLDVTCKTQDEIDRYWSKLTADGGEEGPCGWLKDRFGVSWQIVPEQLGQMLTDAKSGNSEACLNAMLKMKKLDIAELERAYRGTRVA